MLSQRPIYKYLITHYNYDKLNYNCWHKWIPLETDTEVNRTRLPHRPPRSHPPPHHSTPLIPPRSQPHQVMWLTSNKQRDKSLLLQNTWETTLDENMFLLPSPVPSPASNNSEQKIISHPATTSQRNTEGTLHTSRKLSQDIKFTKYPHIPLKTTPSYMRISSASEVSC